MKQKLQKNNLENYLQKMRGHTDKHRVPQFLRLLQKQRLSVTFSTIKIIMNIG